MYCACEKAFSAALRLALRVHTAASAILNACAHGGMFVMSVRHRSKHTSPPPIPGWDTHTWDMGRLLWRPASRSRSGCGEAGGRGDCTVHVCMYVEPIEVYAWRVHDVHVFACETACVRKCKPVDDRTITIPQQASVNEPTLKCEM